ncbi:MAG: hypothetical protein KAJ51_02345, partial [Thermoplasmata archaeon]|nr:hypothetical protein [Thermoplasmata archaeon]
AYSVLYNNGIKDNIIGLYLSIKEDKNNLNYQLKKLNMNIEANEDKILFLDLAAIRLTTKLSHEAWFQLIKTSITDLQKMNKCELLVIDSLDTLLTITNLWDNPIETFDFMRWLKDLKLTVLLISEKLPFEQNNETWDVAYLSDGIIQIDNYYGSTSAYRRIRTIKMRGINHSYDFFKLNISSDGLNAQKI